MELTDYKTDIILVIGIIALLFLTWIVFASLKNKIAADESKTGAIFGSLILILLWAVLIYGSINRIQTGEYPKEVLRIVGLEPAKIGDIGMNNKGRQLMCRWLNDDLKDLDNFSIVCSGEFNQQIVFLIKKLPVPPFAKLNFEEMALHMKKPLSDLFKGIPAWRLKGDKEITPINIIKERLNKLGAKNIGDFYASCGFEKYIARDEVDNSNILEMTFSNKQYGSNPVKITSNHK